MYSLLASFIVWTFGPLKFKHSLTCVLMDPCIDVFYPCTDVFVLLFAGTSSCSSCTTGKYSGSTGNEEKLMYGHTKENLDKTNLRMVVGAFCTISWHSSCFLQVGHQPLPVLIASQEPTQDSLVCFDDDMKTWAVFIWSTSPWSLCPITLKHNPLKSLPHNRKYSVCKVWLRDILKQFRCNHKSHDFQIALS